MCVCVRVCVSACARARVRVCVEGGVVVVGRLRGAVCVRACVLRVGAHMCTFANVRRPPFGGSSPCHAQKLLCPLHPPTA